ncbi:MAG: GFA family protein [Gammaproteobacteria bacterium]|nr:GFA family protein [Gammaproteobacteria bacterium]
MNRNRHEDATGGCHCSKVRYAIRGMPLVCYACHCTDCQSASGSAFGLSMILNQPDIELVSGDLSINKYKLNGKMIQRHHCADCGITLWLSSPSFGSIIVLKPGTLDDTSSFKPDAHVWYRSAQPWIDVGSDIPVYQEQPEIHELLALGCR